uniref:PH domain-containing protein n=1 Tax=Rhizochromulina marina TaxID=1034831 RepID=A0A7S2SIK7_9STRA
MSAAPSAGSGSSMGSTRMRTSLNVTYAPDGTTESVSGILQKRRPTNIMAALSPGWKTRQCTIRGSMFSWSEHDGSELGEVDLSGAKVDGEALRAGGSDMDSQPKHLIISIKPEKQHGKPMELKAASVSDARQWIQFLQQASKGELDAGPDPAAAASNGEGAAEAEAPSSPSSPSRPPAPPPPTATASAED